MKIIFKNLKRNTIKKRQFRRCFTIERISECFSRAKKLIYSKTFTVRSPNQYSFLRDNINFFKKAFFIMFNVYLHRKMSFILFECPQLESAIFAVQYEETNCRDSFVRSSVKFPRFNWL